MRTEQVLLTGALVLLVTFIVVAISSIAFYLRLKRHEYDTWVSLGSPMPGVNLDTYNFATVRTFLKSKRHHSLRDQRSASLGDLVVLTDRVFLGVIASVCLLVGYLVWFVKP